MKIKLTKLPLPKAQNGLSGYDIPELPKKLTVPSLNIPGVTPPQFIMPQEANVLGSPIQLPVEMNAGTAFNTQPGSNTGANWAWQNPDPMKADTPTWQQGYPGLTESNGIIYSKPENNNGITNWQKFNKVAKSPGAQIGSFILNQGLNQIDQKRKIREFNRDFRNQQFDITGMASPEFEGNYDINTGMFQPNRMFNPNEGAGVAEEGGQIDNTMKIRITGIPMENMAYGGQSGYGLDLGRKEVYTDMLQGRSESISKSLTAVPRDMANIEAEGGETVYGDLDGDGGLEHMKIKGKRHIEGGVPLNVPEGSFIFSDTKKMRIKDPAILAKFGASYSRGGVTPAAIAKKYDINKYKAIMEDPNADPLAKSTAQMMVKNYQNKLAQLALVQEGMKGFPGGIPQVAQSAMPEDLAQGMPSARYGGYLYKYQGADAPSTVGTANGAPESYDWNKDFDELSKLYMSEENQNLRDALYSQYVQSVNTGDMGEPMSGDDFHKNFLEAQRQIYAINEKYKDNPEFLKSRNWDSGDNSVYNTEAGKLGFTPLNVDQIKAFQQGFRDLQTLLKTNPEFQQTYGQYVNTDPRGLADQTMTLNGQTFAISGVDGKWGNTTVGQIQKLAAKKTPPEKVEEEIKYVTGYKCVDDGAGGLKLDTKSFKDAAAVAAEGYSTTMPSSCATPNKVETKTFTGKDVFDFTTPDKLSMLASGMFAPQYQAPWSRNLSFRPNRLALQDWQAQAQAIGSNTATAANTLGAYQPGQALASNMSFLQGQAADQIGKSIAATDAANVDRYNNFEMREGMRKDQVDMLNWKNMTDLYDKGVLAKDAFQKDSIAAADRFTKSFGNAWDNRAKWYMMNTTNPVYGADPRSGVTYFKNGYGPEYFSSVAGGRGGSGWGDMYSDYQRAKTEFPGLTEDQYFRNRNRTTETDTDGDRIPDRTTTRRGKKGGQVNSLIQFLMGGYSFDPRDY